VSVEVFESVSILLWSPSIAIPCRFQLGAADIVRLQRQNPAAEEHEFSADRYRSMSIQLSVGARNAWLDAIETAIGASAKLHIYSGSIPASCATAASGTKLAEFSLASGPAMRPAAQRASTTHR
jgi:hypothetical protein